MFLKRLFRLNEQVVPSSRVGLIGDLCTGSHDQSDNSVKFNRWPLITFLGVP